MEATKEHYDSILVIRNGYCIYFSLLQCTYLFLKRLFRGLPDQTSHECKLAVE